MVTPNSFVLAKSSPPPTLGPSAAIPPYDVVPLYVVTLQTICSHSTYMDGTSICGYPSDYLQPFPHIYMEWSPYMWLPFRLSAAILHIWSGPPTCGYPSDYLQPFPHMMWSSYMWLPFGLPAAIPPYDVVPLYVATLHTTCSHSPI